MTVCSSLDDIDTDLLYQMFDRKSSRQRIVLLLFAMQIPVKEMCEMTVLDLQALDFPEEIEYCRDEIIEELDDDSEGAPVFVYPGGNTWEIRDFRRVLRQTTTRHYGFPISAARFAEELSA